MQRSSRHQCLVYNGSPARHLSALAALMHQKLNERNHCLYLDSHAQRQSMPTELD
jgi:hypothetical protein